MGKLCQQKIYLLAVIRTWWSNDLDLPVRDASQEYHNARGGSHEMPRLQRNAIPRKGRGQRQAISILLQKQEVWMARRN
jgi:hypothetical protein